MSKGTKLYLEVKSENGVVVFKAKGSPCLLVELLCDWAEKIGTNPVALNRRLRKKMVVIENKLAVMEIADLLRLYREARADGAEKIEETNIGEKL